MLEEMLNSRPPSNLTRSFTEVTTVAAAPKSDLSLEQRKSAAVQIYRKETTTHEEVNEFEAELASQPVSPENVEDEEVEEKQQPESSAPEQEEDYRSDDNEIRMNFHRSSGEEASDDVNEEETSIKPYSSKPKDRPDDIIA